MLPSRRKEFAQWIGGVTFTVAAILALAFWLQGGWDRFTSPAHDADHAESPAQPRVPASGVTTQSSSAPETHVSTKPSSL